MHGSNVGDRSVRSPTGAPPGRYPAPWNPATSGWWDGEQWSTPPPQPSSSPARRVGPIVVLYVVLSFIGYLAIAASDTSHVLETCTDTSTWSLTDAPLSTALWVLGILVAAVAVSVGVVRRHRDPVGSGRPIPEMVALVLAVVLPWLGPSVACGG